MPSSSVDTSIYPHATGAAARLAEEHKSDHPLRLYGGWFCPFVQRAWIVLVEKGIPHQYVEINPYDKDPSFLALNPRGLVPTLAVPAPPHSASQQQPKQGRPLRPLYESTVICEYLEEAYRDRGPRLLPPFSDDEYGDLDPATAAAATAYERARCRLWIDHVGTRIVPAFYRLLQHTPDTTTYTIDEARAQLHAHLKAFAQEMLRLDDERGLSSTGPWFLGDRFSLVDVVLAPWAKRLFLIDHYKPGGVGIPAVGQRGDNDERVWARWEKWFDAIVERESVRRTWSDDDKYVDVYKRYAENTTQSEVGKATREGGKLP
ncbi:hypothetical protein VTK73DRAFT_2821 [Phialemonium thermophilum]|uniref:Glutathione S-transferase n=1 Tax=Phialemonium thermophilum TaxID=223376 RepID=A0ABR3X2U8_9PEZI